MSWYDYASRSAKQIRDIAAAGKAIAVLPVGSVEQHGPHLAVGTDSYLSQSYARMAMEKVGDTDATFLVLPGLMYALSVEHINLPGTVTLSPKTFLATLEDIGASLDRAGIQTLVFLNCHGGNEHILQVAARQIHLCGMKVLTVCIYSTGNAGIMGTLGAADYAVHADKTETSAMMALHPECVDMSAATPALDASIAKWAELADYKSDLIETWFAEDYAVEGVIGDATASNVEFGREWVRKMTDEIAKAFKVVAEIV